MNDVIRAANWCCFLASVVASSQTARAEGLSVSKLRCEYRVNPLGIDEVGPRLTWLVCSSERGQSQSAYQILVASNAVTLANNEGDLWDTGKVASSRTVNVRYEGTPLRSRQACCWKVRVWDRAGKASHWSEPAMWSMGLLTPEDWRAEYISYRDETPVFKNRESLFLPAARQYRKAFAIDKKPVRAMAYATALGIYELHINGNRVGDAYFTPGWTDYHRRAYYQTYDVTELLQAGDNTIGTWVADGWYSGYVGFGLLVGLGTERLGRYIYGKTPSVMVQLELEFADGTREVIASDTSWKVTGNGPIQEADLLMGEYYDARREIGNWSRVGLEDSAWEDAVLAGDNAVHEARFYDNEGQTYVDGRPKLSSKPIVLKFQRPKLEAFPSVPVRITEEIRPVTMTQREVGTYIFDLGQNFAGNVRLRVKGPAGHRVGLRYGEMLHPDGRLMTENLRRARAQDTYVCRGDSAGEVYTPRFTFHGFQYVEVSNYPGVPNLDTIRGLVMHSDTPLTSEFECSDPMVNQLFSNIVWTQRANFFDLPTDCPQRDERMGWTGDAQVYIGSATYNADVSAFFSKWLRELMESQQASGVFCGYAPYPFRHGFDFGTAWSDAGVICPWTVWQTYDDKRVIDRCWPAMTRFLRWRKKVSPDYLGNDHGNPWGDWLTQGPKTPIDYIDTVYFATCSQKMAEMAAATNRTAEAEQYQRCFTQIQRAFARKYIQSDRLSVDTQTAYALALHANLIPKSKRITFGARLARMVESNRCRMTTGFLGTGKLLPVLSATNQHDLATFLLQSHEFPSWGYEIDQGATSIWERWDSYTKEDGFGRHNADMNSFAHYSFGAVCEWMFAYLAGIQSDGPGYKRIVIRPLLPTPGSNADHRPIDWVRASYDSIRGRVSSAWRIDGDRFKLEVDIPVNATATVHLPTADLATVTVGDQQIDRAAGVALVSNDGASVALSCESGQYVFTTKHGLSRPDKAYSCSLGE